MLVRQCPLCTALDCNLMVSDLAGEVNEVRERFTTQESTSLLHYTHSTNPSSIHVLNELSELSIELRSMYGTSTSSCSIVSARRRFLLSLIRYPMQAPKAARPTRTSDSTVAVW